MPITGRWRSVVVRSATGDWSESHQYCEGAISCRKSFGTRFPWKHGSVGITLKFLVTVPWTNVMLRVQCQARFIGCLVGGKPANNYTPKKYNLAIGCCHETVISLARI